MLLPENVEHDHFTRQHDQDRRQKPKHSSTEKTLRHYLPKFLEGIPQDIKEKTCECPENCWCEHASKINKTRNWQSFGGLY